MSSMVNPDTTSAPRTGLPSRVICSEKLFGRGQHAPVHLALDEQAPRAADGEQDTHTQDAGRVCVPVTRVAPSTEVHPLVRAEQTCVWK